MILNCCAIAAEQRLGLSDANKVSHSSQISSPTVSPFRQWCVFMISCTAPSYDPQMLTQHQPLYPTQYAHLSSGSSNSIPCLKSERNATTPTTLQQFAVLPSSTFPTSFTLPRYT